MYVLCSFESNQEIKNTHGSIHQMQRRPGRPIDPQSRLLGGFVVLMYTTETGRRFCFASERQLQSKGGPRAGLWVLFRKQLLPDASQGCTPTAVQAKRPFLTTRETPTECVGKHCSETCDHLQLPSEACAHIAVAASTSVGLWMLMRLPVQTLSQM
jgi:hypothetical protein